MIQRHNRNLLLTLPRSLCVFTEVHNVQAQDIAMLSRMNYRYMNSTPYKCIEKWNAIRSAIGYHPPDGWPLRVTMAILATVAVFVTMWIAQKNICSNKNKCTLDCGSKAFLSSKNKKGANLRSEVFDGDSDTIIVDNSANCVIWKHKKNFVPETYVALDKNNMIGVASAVGSGVPIAIGDLNIGRRDDNGQYHKFVIQKVFHIPDSPVNIY